MLRGVTHFFDRMVQRFLPDAFLFAILLTFVVFGLGIAITDSSPGQMVQFWGDGFWDLLAFAMQMSLIVVTGYILANTPLVKSVLSKLSKLARTPAQAILLVTFVAGLACLVNYGFGLVVGALLAIHVARRVPNVDYRLLMASAYSGFLLWHGGLSASIPLTIATEDHFLADSIGAIAITETLFSEMNIFIIVTLLLSLPLLNLWLLKSNGDLSKDNRDFLKEENAAEQHMAATTAEMTPAERLENSRIISLLIGLLGLLFILYHFMRSGFELNINIVNFIFLFLGILFHQTPRRFLNSIHDAVQNAGGIIIQFPFYAGIMGMMVASGLSEQMSNWFVSISTEFTFPLFAFISAGIVNFFVPSGGGQWAVQAPIMVPAALDLGVSTAKTAMAVAWGDAWTNMIQPFWALPLLAIAGLKVKDIMGFCVIILFWSFIPISIGLLFLH
ncbi:short-chain fatty acid transporter [Halobacillus karajensis]|uniref:Short-chain fatty acids transporter n=1 Tax=Halobacillus karajensis TaxID=195088 RepID=A0A024P5N7_9BACI|nr:short-chain fatty acid transporter [Halobacillus karajensis]CDQ20555.1 Short-chain fatty acids transporter [Halobacillus karajensis]CDQ23976.1 Short-chain fatty acids transporter [Halobacillus karajensis]CDQ27454.1 Short-chain fatty acids transporter [Halobacillus karajensis]